MMRSIQIKTATVSNVEPSVNAIALGFSADPVVHWFFPPDHKAAPAKALTKPENYFAYCSSPRDDYFAHPDAIAEEVFHITHQHPSTWSFDHIIRPFAEKW